MTRRVVVVGGDATGMSAAAGIKRSLGDAVEVVVFERQRWTSYSACGIPYWLAGETDGPDSLVARTPERHRANGLDVRTRTEVIGFDPAARTISTQQETVSYDDLVLATGARPVRLDVPGWDLPGVHGVHTLDDGLAVLETLAGNAQRAVVVGAGYIGVEMAEAMALRGLTVTIVDMADQPMSTLDPDMGALVAQGLTRHGVGVRGGCALRGFRSGAEGGLSAVETSGGVYPADIAIVGLGVRPATELFGALPRGRSGGLLTDDHQRVVGYDNVWAGGDCCEVRDRITGETRHVALGTHANKHGRVIAANIAGDDLIFPGVVGTAVTKAFDVEIGRVGLTGREAAEHGFEVVKATIDSTTRAGYYPGATSITVRMLAQRRTGRVLGCQIVGGPGSAKRIDAAAVAIWHEMTANDVAGLDLGYAPPFSPVWDPVQIAARVLANRLRAVG